MSIKHLGRQRRAFSLTWNHPEEPSTASLCIVDYSEQKDKHINTQNSIRSASNSPQQDLLPEVQLKMVSLVVLAIGQISRLLLLILRVRQLINSSWTSCALGMINSSNHVTCEESCAISFLSDYTCNFRWSPIELCWRTQAISRHLRVDYWL